MATAPTPAPKRDFNDVGTFVSSVAVGFVLATERDMVQINQALRANGSKLTKTFLDNLLTIKLLAPDESRDLMIQPTSQIQSFVSSLRQGLLLKYYFMEMR